MIGSPSRSEASTPSTSLRQQFRVRYRIPLSTHSPQPRSSLRAVLAIRKVTSCWPLGRLRRTGWVTTLPTSAVYASYMTPPLDYSTLQPSFADRRSPYQAESEFGDNFRLVNRICSRFLRR